LWVWRGQRLTWEILRVGKVGSANYAAVVAFCGFASNIAIKCVKLRTKCNSARAFQGNNARTSNL
jgi:hypothetical protein